MSTVVSETAVSRPALPLRPFITEYAGFRVSGLPHGAHYGLPSRDVDLIISLGRPIDVLQMPNSVQRPSAFAALVSGLQDAPAVVRQQGDVFGLHVYIKPFGVRATLGLASCEISSLVLSLTDVWGSRGLDLVERLQGARTWQQRFSILDRIFMSRLNPICPQPEIAWAWQKLAASHGSLPVQQVADAVGWSRQHFSDRFRDATGVTPKSAARVFRFEHACRLIRDERAGLASVAASCGYFDQAHMTREWNTLAGCSPREWIARELPFLQDYELGGRDNECDDTRSDYQPLF